MQRREAPRGLSGQGRLLEEETYGPVFVGWVVYMMRKEEESVPGGPSCELS